MSETSSVVFNINASGSSVVIPNGSCATSNLAVSYNSAGSISGLSFTIEGIVSPATAASDYGPQPGSPVALYSNNASSVSNASVSLSSVLYDSFRVTASWSGQGSVSGSLTATSAPGRSFTSKNLPAVQEYGPLTPV